MPKQSKRLLAALLAVVMLCSLLPVTALAEEPAVEELPIVEETPAEETPVEEAEAAPVESDTPEQEAAADEPAADEAELVIEDVSEAAAYNAEGSLTLGEPMTITLSAGYPSYSFTAAVKGTYTFKGYDYDYANVDIRGFLYSDADCTNMVASCTEYDVGQYFDATYTMEAGQTVYWELNETERRTCQITLLVTLPVKDPVALYQDEPGITTIDSNGVVYAFDPSASGDHTFRIYSNAPMSGVLYSDDYLTDELATGNRDDNNGTYVLTAELCPGNTYYLKVLPSVAYSDMSCAVVVGPDSESSLNNGSWVLGTGSPWYLDTEYKLHGSSVLYNTDRELTLTEGEDYQLKWYWVDGTYHKDSSGLPRAGLYALVAKATENSGRSGALVRYVTVLQANNLGSCEFADTTPIIVDGKLIAREDVIWLVDGSTVPASAYTLTWYSDADGQLVAMEAAPTEAGEYCLKATPAEGSGWSGSLEREYVIHSYTSTSLRAGSNDVSFTDDDVENNDVVYTFTPEKSGTYRITVQIIGNGGYFELLPMGGRYDFNEETSVCPVYTLTAGTTYYIYVNIFGNGKADLSIDIDEYVKPGGALTLGEARSADIPADDTAEFTFTAPADGTYDISVKGTAQEGFYSFDNENWYAYGTEAYDTQRIDLVKDEAVTLYVQSEAEDSVTALVEQYIKPGGALTLGEARSADIPKNESAEFTFTAPEAGTYDFFITGASCTAWYSFDGNNWSNYGTDRKTLEKDEAVTLYVNSEAANTVTVLVEKYVKPGGTLTLGEALSTAIPAHEIAEFTFTAPEDGIYSISLMGTDCPGWYSFDNEDWWTYSAEEYDTENWDLAEGETLTLYVAPDAADTVTVLVKEYKGNAIQIAEPGAPGSDEETPIMLRGGTSLKLTATITDPELKGQAILWDMGSIYDTSYAAVNAKGVVSTREVPEPVPVSVKAYLKADPEVSGTVYLLLVPAVQYVSIYSETAPNNGVISVDLSGATAEAPAQLQLYAAAEPSYALQTGVWKSSNAKIATVDQDGLVTFVKAGEVTITFTAADGSKKSSTVRLCGGIPVSTLTISSSAATGPILTLTSGQKATLKATVNPDATNKAVTWSSSDPDVATASASGVVTAKTVYEVRFVTITAVAKDGSGIHREAGILVEPKANVLALYLDEMVVNGTTQTGNYLGNGKEFFLEADATTWKSSNAKIATVDDEGHVTFLKPGKVTITAKNGTRSGSVTLQSINFITGIQLRTADGKTEGDEIFLASGKGKVTLKATEAMLGGTGKAVPVIWTSDEPDVAAVNAKGVVTAKAGVYEDTFVTITATAKDGSGISQSFTLMVVPLATTVSIYSWNDLEIENAPGEVQEDELLNNRILVVDLEKQATLDLWSVAAPYSLEASALQAVTWKSSSAKVATVENGRVTLKAPGTVTISVTTADGSKKTASFKLTVVRYAKGIEPAETELALASGCKTTLKYTLVTDTNAKVSDSKVLFSLVNPEDAAYVTLTDKGVITAKAVTESHTVPVRITYAANRSIYAEVNVTAGPA